ncbi:MAG: DUF3126 family protein [Bradyrhizobiaceae bacterium]|nr:DUF3126 family protein [Bradyrhizobiaceae bacterium]
MKRIALLFAAFVAGVVVGQSQLVVPHAAWAIGSPVGHNFKDEAKPISTAEAGRIETYLRRVFGNSAIRLDRQPPEADVYLGKQFLGLVYPDETDGERAFYFEMAILAADLDPGTASGSSR